MANYFRVFILIILLPALSHTQSQDLKFERISVEQGLSQSTIYDILQDSKGFMWFGTEDGLNKYDGYDFTIYKNNPNDSSSLSHNYVWSIYEDKSGVIWIGTWGGGLNKFDRETGKFIHYQHDPSNPNSLSDNLVMSICEDKYDVLWIGTMKGGFCKLERETGKFTQYQHNPDNTKSLSNNSIITIYTDKIGKLWIGTWGYGLNKFDPKTGKFIHYQHDPNNPNSLSSNVVVSIYEDRSGVLWIGTENSGLNKFDRETGQFTRYKHNPYNPNSLSNNAINSMYIDKSNVLWVGTFGGGLNKFDQEKVQFTHYQQNPDSPNILKNISVWSLNELRSGDMNILLIGTGKSGLYIFNRETGQFTNYQNDPNDSNSLSNNTVCTIFESTYGGSSVIWIGTSAGLNRLDQKKGQFRHYLHDPADPYSISDNIVRSICEDKSGKIWVGTRYGGLNKLEPETGKFTHYQHDPNNPNSLSHNAVITIFESHHTRKGILWIGTYGGLNKLDQKTEQFTHYMHDPADPYSISNNNVRSIYEDQSGILWIGTYDGLNKFDELTGQFIHYTDEDGLPNNVINGILEDKYGNLWLGTNNGLSKFNPETKACRNYDVNDGLHSNEFNIEACLKSKDGKMFFGSVNGLNAFYPDSLKDNPHIPEIVITDFQIFNEPVEIIKDELVENKDIFLLPKHISTTQEIELSYRENVFSFEFAALDYRSPQKNKYSYKMEGIDPDWVYTDASRRFASYTQLDPGEYIFRVKGSNNDGLWNEEGRSIKIIITPPWWRTDIAYLIYAILIMGMVFGVWRFQTNRLKMQQQLEMEHFEAEKLREVDHLKSRFFANISHEFRTPLTLIKGPVKQILTREFKGNLDEQCRMILRYSDRLLNLINQILDLSKLESGRMKLQVNQTDLIQNLKGIVQSFVSLAERKNITFKFETLKESLLGYVDRDKLEKIITNLLSNAFKFTPEGGEVTINLSLRGGSRSEAMETTKQSPSFEGDEIATSADWRTRNEGQIEISISNTGPGIASDQLERIFDRFYQADTTYKKDGEGTGIGLALTKELVQACHGEIQVESEPDKTTTFTVLLPIGKEHLTPEEIVEGQDSGEGIMDKGKKRVDLSAYITQYPASSIKSPLLLIVEDNPDVTAYIHSFLEQDYRIISAENGKEGWEKALQKFPDLVISDVMMPEMDGFELCKKIKSNQRTSHIPVILLTAKADLDSKLEGLEFGADDYISKPFEADELKVRAKNLVEQRQKLREKFSKQIEIKPGEIAASSMDEQFLERLLSVFEKHLSESGYSTESFAREVGMSRSHLHRKLKALTDLSTHEFILNMRLKRAAQLLKKKAGNVSEIAYTVGFENPANFSKAFKNQFGQSPRDFVKEMKNQ